MKQTLLVLLALICLNAKAVTPEPAITMTTEKSVGETIKFLFSANADNTVIQIDFGDGTLVAKTIGTLYTAISGPLVGSQTVKIYGTGINYLGCSSNLLTYIDVTKNTALKYLYCYSNKLTSLDVTKNTALSTLYCNKNKLTSLDVTKNTALAELVCYSNQLTFVSLPLIKPTTFSYAPQSAFNIAPSFAINTPIDLSSQLNFNGKTTTYTWKTETGTTLTAATDYTISGGITTFIKIPTQKVYCEMTNTTFPYFSGADVLKTTLTTIGTTTTVEDAKADVVDIYTHNQTVYLSLPEDALVQVYDITGHLVKSQNCISGINSFEVPQKGIFVIKVNMNNQSETRKIVVR